MTSLSFVELSLSITRPIPQTLPAFVEQFEGCRLEAYYDEAGNLTIGFGHKCLPTEHFVLGTKITMAYAIALFNADMASPAAFISHYLPNVNALTANEYAAMLSLGFNIGIGNLAHSTLLIEVKAGSMIAAAEQFLVWDKVKRAGVLVPDPGLLRRREAEKELFLTPVQ